jgi:hypothetical protein
MRGAERLKKRFVEQGWNFQGVSPRDEEIGGYIGVGNSPDGDIGLTTYTDREGFPEKIIVRQRDSTEYVSGKTVGEDKSTPELPWNKDLPRPEEAAGILDRTLPENPF